MSEPVLLIVGGPERLPHALEGRYAGRCRVAAAATAAEGAEVLRSGGPVAVVLAAQDLPDQGGIEFLAQARALNPGAKRVLVARATDDADLVEALKTHALDHFLSVPCDPPEQFLYPVLDDMLADWEERFRAEGAGIRVVGYRFSPESHQTRDFLTRNCIGFQWLDIDQDAEARDLMQACRANSSVLPLVVFPDGTQMLRPDSKRLAEKLGLRVHPQQAFHDLVIVGGGPAGLAAAVYGASEGLRTVLLERKAPGGQAALSSMIENYLGFPAGLSGADLARRAVAQARKFGVEVVAPREVHHLEKDGATCIVTLEDGERLYSHVVILALGVEWRRLDVPGCDRLVGAGVYYGGTLAEAMFCRNEDICIVGGGNSAGQAALYFSRYARGVAMLVRDSTLDVSMSKYLIDQLAATPNVRVMHHTVVAEAHGEDRLEAVTVEDVRTGQRERLEATALFIFIGLVPHTEWLEDVVRRDERGFILTGHDLVDCAAYSERPPFWLETSTPGVFAVGDGRHGSVKRVAAGVGEGSTAVSFVHQYLRTVQSGT